MDNINYLSNSQTSQTGKFPVTIQGLEFTQKQIKILQNIAFLGADSYILKPSTITETGVCVIRGEVLPLMSVRKVSDTHITISVTKETIRTDSGDYQDVREIRTARYTRLTAQTYYDDLNIPLSKLHDFKTNAYLWERLQEILNTPTTDALPIEVGQFGLLDLDEKKTRARLFCSSGSARVGNMTAYTVDVYECDNSNIYQEVKGSDLRRYGRYYNNQTGNWEKFQPIDEQNNIEGKVIRGSLYIRHGFLPPYAKIIVLRKKRRNSCAGSGRRSRSVKCAYYHGWKMEFSKGTPNTWYIPKCIKADSYFRNHIGREFSLVMTELLYREGSRNGRKYWRIAGVHKKWTTAKTAYAKLAIAVIHNTTHNLPATSMLKLKFRVWTLPNKIRKCISVD